MINRFVAFFALAVLIGFLGILVYRVPRLDLAGVVAVTVLLAAYDIWRNASERD